MSLAAVRADGAIKETLVSPSGAATTYRKDLAKILNTSSAETDLLNGEITIDAGVMGSNRVLRLSTWIDGLMNSGSPTLRFKLKLGGTVIFDSGVSNALVASAARGPILFSAEGKNQNSPSAQAWRGILSWPSLGGGGFAFGSFGPFTVGEGWGISGTAGWGYILPHWFNKTTVNTAIANLLELTATISINNVLNEIKLESALVEII